MVSIKEIKDSFLHFIFPHICIGCGSDLLQKETMLCMRCMDALPETNFELYPGNPVEKIFWGRLKLAHGTAQYYFNKESLMQHLLHEFKYNHNKELGWQLGKIMGIQLKKAGRFDADALIPLPLFPAKEKKRGYNQAAVLCRGISESMNIPVLDQIITRSQYTESQTKKSRVERWKNMEEKFILTNPEAIHNKHLLLVDDVVTTGATLESCANELLKAPHVTISIATLCLSNR